jgi:hypothetical protein
MIKYLLLLFISILGVTRTSAQDKFVDKGELVATFPIQIESGYLFVKIPMEDTNVYGEKITVPRSFLLDPSISNDGNFVPFDSNGIVITRAIQFLVPVSNARTLKLELVPTEAREGLRNIEKDFMGVLGYGFIKRYRSVIDIFRKEIRLYSLASDITYSKLVDSMSTRTYYFDDAIISYCSCQFPSMWLDVKAPPVKEGRVHLSLGDNQSTIFRDALDKATLSIIEKEEHADSLAGKQNFGGISVGQFYIGGKNIAGRNPKRTVVKRPAKFKDLNIEVVGTLAMDVLKTYEAIIIDPTRFEIMMVRW